MRTVLPLNDDWYFKPSFDASDVSLKQPDQSFEKIRLPHTNQMLPLHYFDESIFQFHSCYAIHLPKLDVSVEQLVVIHFEGVMSYAEVYVDGVKLAEHKGGYTPFSVDVTEYINDDSHLLMVHVDSTERPDTPPFGFVVDYLTYGGIYREVQLEVKSKVHLDHIKVETPKISGDQYAVILNTTLTDSKHGSYSSYDNYSIIGQLYDGDTLIAEQKGVFTDTCDASLKIDAPIEVIEWDLHHPKRYRAEMHLIHSKGDQITTFDRIATPFGFRTATFEKDGFYLNGKKLKLRGLNRHQSFPYVGYAMPKSAQYKDADLLKFELGCNIVRSSHYPPSRHFLDRCDEIGLLVFNEIPGWQHIGDNAWQSTSLKNVEEMIRRDWNHPSVIIWGVRINESADSDAFYEKTNALAKSLDTSRATGGVRNFSGSRLFEDVYTYNDFIHRGDNIALEPPKRISKANAPYLVTEHNGHMFPTKSFDGEAKRIEHALRHARVLEAAYATEGISGAIGWCMSDYNTHKDFGSGDRICYHGVLDMFRIPKYAAAVYASQSEVVPYMSVLSSMFVGDFDASELGRIFVFTNCDQLKVYKNEQPIGIFHPDVKNFGHLPHPPIVVDDLIGDLIAKNERFSEADALSIKQILLKFVEHGAKLPLLYKLKMGQLFLKYKMNFADAARLYGKYVASWGDKSTTFRFNGYKDGQLCMSIERNAASTGHLSVEPDTLSLHEGETYDVTRVVVRYCDAYGQTLNYANHLVTVSFDGPVEVIGPKSFSLIGGVRAFWVKSVKQTGVAHLTVQLEAGDSVAFDLTVN